MSTTGHASPRVKPLLLRRDTWSDWNDSPRGLREQEMHLSTLLCAQASTGDLEGNDYYHFFRLDFTSSFRRTMLIIRYYQGFECLRNAFDVSLLFLKADGLISR